MWTTAATVETEKRRTKNSKQQRKYPSDTIYIYLSIYLAICKCEGFRLGCEIEKPRDNVS